MRNGNQRKNQNRERLVLPRVDLLLVGFGHALLGESIQFDLGGAIWSPCQLVSIPLVVAECGCAGLVLALVSS